MAVTVNFYNNFFEQQLIGGIDWDTDTFSVTLHTAETFLKTDDFWDDVSATEVSGTGYTTGGVNLASITVTQDDTNNRAIIDFANPEWTSSTISATDAVIFKDTGTPGTSTLVANIDFGATFASSGSTFRIELDSVGFATLEAA